MSMHSDGPMVAHSWQPSQLISPVSGLLSRACIPRSRGRTTSFSLGYSTVTLLDTKYFPVTDRPLMISTNVAFSMIFFKPMLNHTQNHSGGNKIHQGQWQKYFPADVHKLVITIPRNRPSYPHEEEYDGQHLADKPDEARYEAQNLQRRPPSPQIKGSNDGGDHDHAHVLTHHVHAPAHARVLSHVASNQLMRGLWQIKGAAVQLCDGRHEEDGETDQLRQPEPIPEVTRLLVHNIHQTQGARHNNHPHQRQPHCNFIRDHLRTRAQAAQKGPTIVGGPSPKNYPIDGYGTQRQKHNETRIEVGDDHIYLVPEYVHTHRAERNQGHRNKRRDEEYVWSQAEDWAVGPSGS